jgi:gliding motility-associated-like protein
MKKNIFITAVLLFMVQFAWATHNRAGEIVYKQIGPREFEVMVITYTRGDAAIPPDRNEVEVNWGDNLGAASISTLPRVNGSGNGQLLANNVKYNVYVGRHTYGSQGIFKVSMNDKNRVDNILNVNFPNSGQVPFQIETTIKVLNALYETNSSPELLQAPIDIGYIGQVFVHNPNAYDVEGDSITYELIVPRADGNSAVPNYLYPDGIVPGSNNQISLDPLTGTFTWNSPQKEGEYNIAFMIREYRSKRLLSTIIRDMQITIKKGNNKPPVINAIDELCVIAGETVNFLVTATDPDIPQQRLKLTATGGPFKVDINTNPVIAEFHPSPRYEPQPVIVPFTWQTQCENVREQYYQVVFRAADDYEKTVDANGHRDTTGLSTLKVVRIHVIAPAPANFQAVGESGKVKLTWDKPYSCEGLSQQRFRGFNVWRQSGCKPLTIDKCGTNLAAQGYTKIASFVTTSLGARYFYDDATVQRGRQYTYVIEAIISEKNNAGFVTNTVYSLPSERKCVQVARDLPLMTNVDIRTTAATTGEIFVQWSKPSLKDLDTLVNQGPYQYVLYRTDGITGGTFVQIWASPLHQSILQSIDTNFTDINKNTLGQPYQYQIGLKVRTNDLLGVSAEASSHFLKVSPTDHKNVLTWESNVPWSDNTYEIWRRIGNVGAFTQIATATTPTYTDTLLINNNLYCYKIKAIGSYNQPGVLNPLLNWSQEACASPIDNVPPCPPVLSVTNDCATASGNTPGNSLKNILKWTIDGGDYNCRKNSIDIIKYNIYYAKAKDAPFTLVGTIDQRNIRTFIHEGLLSIAGCYRITAIDSIETPLGGGNESAPSNVFCVDNCPSYELPNVFTPNGDGMNDTYTPFIPWRFVTRIDIKIFNRWGGLVYQTTDPNINWNGKDFNDKEVAEGAYFYKCEVFEDRLGGEIRREKALSGFIELIRNQK